MKKISYVSPKILSHSPIRFETSQSWNKGRGPISGDPGKSDGDKYPHDPFEPKKPQPPKKGK
ncbi:hypothetical protein F4694_000590 [Bacillus niacini]|uniref:Uncharacterized protein n=1 Tax=Neobacillus niacini TaxID=86668 RepID=A0A852T6Q0_9BACI|nr:hypothetical protein [Neobacillus niacini]NYE03871.1 hypothetical protein [Neobacillus niacini]